MKIDEISWKILEILQDNSRSALKDIAAEVGLSSPTVAERIQKMEEAGVIESYTTHLNMDRAGYPLGVYISIKIRFGQVQRFEEFIGLVPEICECHKLTGHDCMLMKGFVRDPKHLENLNARLAVYGELTTSLILNSIVRRKTHKEPF
ncbi:Lrp/AsnC family transcriptional regulator [Maribacter algarum]|uniref:Lrp/AsnC family transcriptional regulator n=1 Tax=Maribacter algarum (ex Zhang et al. 2020) TaxID=2578118 RepID=A0A5S3PDR6_9FLAO|nr:Lrp/AsnC family transcriptional regulator [Maribacter algarum]TMM52112.1 Lrp/AsnC family transcriptional regulator [Maribacter algarum]